MHLDKQYELGFYMIMDTLRVTPPEVIPPRPFATIKGALRASTEMAPEQITPIKLKELENIVKDVVKTVHGVGNSTLSSAYDNEIRTIMNEYKLPEQVNLSENYQTSTN